MNANGPGLFREGAMRLRVLADGPDVLHLLCEGDVSLPELRPGDDPLAEFLGPEVYCRKVLLNLEKVGYLDTSGISWLIACHRRFEGAGGALVLHSIPPRARHVLALLHMDRVFHTASGPEAARSLALGGKP
jgi:anti-anti-sigma factor